MITGNRPTLASCALAALATSVVVLAVSCGGSGHRAAEPERASQLVSRALGGQAAVRSGQVELFLSLQAPSAREGFTLHSAARFRVVAAGAAPSLALILAMRSRSGSSPPRALRVALVSGEHGISLSLQGRHLRASPRAQRALQAGYAQLTATPPGGHGPAIAPLGLDAWAWLAAPRFAAASSEGGAGAVHVRAGLALAPFLADVERLASLSAGLEQASGQAGAATLAPALSKAALQESGAGTLDLYADPRRELPRSLAASASLHPSPRAGGNPLPPVSVSLRMSFTALGGAPPAGAS
jgi:hypothetical protein